MFYNLYYYYGQTGEISEIIFVHVIRSLNPCAVVFNLFARTGLSQFKKKKKQILNCLQEIKQDSHWPLI